MDRLIDLDGLEEFRKKSQWELSLSGSVLTLAGTGGNNQTTTTVDLTNATVLTSLSDRITTLEETDYVTQEDIAEFVTVLDLDQYLTESEADSKYLTQNDLTDYLTIEAASNTYLTQSAAAATYLTQGNAENLYLSKTAAASTYLSIIDASSTYLSQADADNIYLTQDAASATYATMVELGDYAEKDLSNVENKSVVTDLIADKAVTTEKIADGAVDEEQLSQGLLGLIRTISTNTQSIEEALDDIGVLQDDSIMSVTVEYALGDSPSIAPVTGWSSNTPTWTAGKYIWQRTATVNGKSVTSYSDPVCIQGAKGEDGENGEDGFSPTTTVNKTGTTTTITVVDKNGTTSATVSDGETPVITTTKTGDTTSIYSNGTKIGEVADGSDGTTPVIGATKTDGVTTITSDGVTIATINDGTSMRVESATKVDGTTTVVIAGSDGTTTTLTIDDGQDGANGRPGVDGTSSYVHIAWATDTNGGGFSTSDSVGKTYLGSYTDETETDSTDYRNYNWSLIKGSRGTSIIKITTAPSSYTTRTGGFTPTYRILLSTVLAQGNVSDVIVGDILEQNYYHYPVGYVDSSYVYLAARTVIRGATWYAGTGITGTSTTPAIYSGSGIVNAIVDDHYLNTSTQDVYICTTEGSASVARWKWEQNIKGLDGAPGSNGSSSYFHVKYSNDGGQTFTGNSGEDPGTYIGTYSDSKQADSTNVSSYVWVKIEGEDGVSPVISTSKTNGVTTISITDATGTKTATVNDGKTPAITTNKSGTTTTIYADGQAIGTVTDGEDGNSPNITATYSNGKTTIKSDGVTIATINDGTSVKISSASKDPDTGITTVVIQDGTTTSTLTIADGADGTDGTPGANGYVHIAWTNDPNDTNPSTSGFSTTDSEGKLYLGSYSDNTQADSTNPSKYNWSLIKGEKGVGITSVVPYYYLSTSSTSVTGGSWSTTQPTWTANHYIWTRSRIYYDNNTSEYTTAILASALNSANQKAAEADAVANNALVSANSKNKVFHQNDAPTTGMITNDTWFDTNDGYKMYRYNGTSWVAEAFGSSAIANLAITNAKIADATIQSAKIATLDAGKITTGTLAADRIGANSITASKIASKTITANEIATGAITADKIDVTDLEAIGATIGGFEISDSAIYSTGKTSVTDTDSGIYLGSDGNINIGNSSQYIQYQNGELSLQVKSLMIGGTAPALVTEAISNVTVEYAVGTSSSTAPTSGWGSATPVWTSGKYVWQRTKTTTGGVVSTSDPVCIQGATGPQGTAGARGATWYAGTAITGTSTTATIFSGSGISSAIVGDHYLNTSTQNVYVCKKAGNASTATWAYEQNIKGAQGTPGESGSNGKTAYFHVKYSNDGGTTFTANSGETAGSYIGTYSDNTAADSTSVSAYTWVKIEGHDGLSAIGLGMRVNYSKFATTNNGECYFHGFNEKGEEADIDGWAMWNGRKMIIAKGMWINPNTAAPYNTVILHVYRTSTAPYHADVWWDTSLKTWRGYLYTTSGTPGTKADWVWNEETDAILATFISPSSEGAFVSSQLFNPPKKFSEINDYASIASAQSTADSALTTANAAIKAVDVEYAIGNSSTTAPTSGWSTNTPTWTSGAYVWTRTKVINGADSTSYSNPTCIQGATGATGKGITSITEQYYLSTSNSTTTGGSWQTTQPSWSQGKYIWTRSQIKWTDNSTTNTTAILANAINDANSLATTASSVASEASSTAQTANSTANTAKNTANAAQATANTALATSEKALSATEIIVGTQTAATGAWTGVATFDSLEDGQSIIYWLPYAGSGNATLNLTLPDGTKTGAKNVYYSGTTRLTTHYPAGNAIRMVYMKTAKIGASTYEGWWCDANYNTNNYDRILYNPNVTAEGAIAAGRLGVFNSNGKLILLSTAAFDITRPILYVGTAYTASALTRNNNYIAWGSSFSLANTVPGFTGEAGKPVFIKGTLSGNMFIPAVGVLTTTVPTTEDGYTYILLGLMNTTVNGTLAPEHPMYRFYKGNFQSVAQLAYQAYTNADNAQSTANLAQTTADIASSAASAARTTANNAQNTANAAARAAAEAAKTATNYLYYDLSNGLVVTRNHNISSTGVSSLTDGNVRITTDGMDIYNGQVRTASYGDTVTLGNTSSSNVNINNSGMLVRYGEDILGSFGNNGIGLGVGQDNKNYLNINSDGFAINQIVQINGDTSGKPVVYDDKIFQITFNSTITELDLATEAGATLITNDNKTLLHTEGEPMSTLSFGVGNTSNGVNTSTFGNGLTMSTRCGFAVGMFNSVDASDIFVVGNGTGNGSKSSALAVKTSGNVVVSGKMTVGINPTNSMDVATKSYVDQSSLKITSSRVITLSNSGWSSGTTTVDGMALYSQTATVTAIHNSHPVISLGAAGTVPTAAEEAAYALIKAAVANESTKKITFYATAVPTTTIRVIAKEVE